MGREQSKAAKWRFHDGNFHTRYFVGDGIDVGSGDDRVAAYASVFARMRSCRAWDRRDGDAQLLSSVDDDAHDFLHASHCLEHMENVEVAITHWIRVVRPGGHLILIIGVPDEDLYEQGHWPSRFNSDHKWTFTICKKASWSPRSWNVTDLVQRFVDRVEVERIALVRDFFREDLAFGSRDQTRNPNAECAIEIIARKRDPARRPGEPES